MILTVQHASTLQLTVPHVLAISILIITFVTQPALQEKSDFQIYVYRATQMYLFAKHVGPLNHIALLVY